VIYVDTSVLLAQLLAEDRVPAEALWRETLVTSRLSEYELFHRLNAHRLAASHCDAARALLSRLALVELAPPVLVRALEPFPLPVRTLDALHLASLHFLRGLGREVALATFDQHQARAARRLGIDLAKV
jgi:predicted nucleic acid-binding protein